MTRISYLSVFTLALALVCVGSLRSGANRLAYGKSEAATLYDRTAWKAKYVRPKSIPFPAGNAYSPQRALLGRTLFFDPRLSGSKFVSCASCHNPGFSWGDGLPKGMGDGMKELPRKTPTLLNLAWAELLFWDGRSESLEQQSLVPISAQDEMNQPLEQMTAAIAAIPEYGPLFAQAYPGEGVKTETIARALATFERTIVSADAPFDEWIAGREPALSEAAKRGFDLFNSKAMCQKCHGGWNFTDDGFHDTGVEDQDLGRGVQLPLEAMQHAFKTPTLRNITRRAPYMHNGSEASLRDVIELYDLGGRARRASLAPEMTPLHLSPQEKADLLSFLKTLTSDDKKIEVPALPR